MGEKIAFLGLGVMGYPMAGHLARAGHDVTAYNRTAAKSEKWVGEYGGARAETPREAVAGAAYVMACVGNDDDLRSVVLGDDGAFAGMGSGAIFCDHTTASADVARELAAAGAENGIGFVDAPVSGGQAGAENGQLTIMCGGDRAAFDKARPLMDCYGKAVTLMGEVGAGQLTKMVNQITIAGLVQALGEGMHFAECAGLDARLVYRVIGKGAAQSWQMDNRHETMIDDRFEYGFAVDWMRKDLRIALAEAERMRIGLPVTALVNQYYGDIQARGGGRWDTSSLVRRLRLLKRGEMKAPQAGK